ncbi:tautomerase family protein [Leptospira wolffii]|uniref:tautomerase family protein n=1 Tax=Leptospira wolffii TaxID=409998 RepID=UPI0002DADF61|nr:4-oxalocrotonate tautomerase family protein [Leptospira wolffii]EPG67794.1 4-oxalocrotonate tautomerase family enzyme [Leptospira wolffii serovar Khorat str. Khorat-H2]
MPYVNVKVAGPLTKEQKKAIVKEITETLSKVAGKAPDSTYIVIDEVSRENWAKGGDLLE